MIGNLFRKKDHFGSTSDPSSNPNSNPNSNTSTPSNSVSSSASSSYLHFPSIASSAYTSNQINNSSLPHYGNNNESNNTQSFLHSSFNTNFHHLHLNHPTSSDSTNNYGSTTNNSNSNELKFVLQEPGVSLPSLYGMQSSTPLPTFKLSDKLPGFRMVIIQDAGIRKKQPLFDSAVTYNKNFSIMQQKLNKKIHHSINELSLFMFGCYGMPISENNMTTKIHYLPALANMHSSVLITRLFSLDSSFKLKPHKMSENSSDWDPHPLLETDELPLYENSSIRFAIGIIIPVSSSIESIRDEITENWLQTSDTLLTLQNLIVSKLKQIYNSHNVPQKKSSYQQTINASVPLHCNPPSVHFGFPIYSLQTEMEIYQKLTSLLIQMISLSEIPRLFVDLKHSNQSLIDWASTLSLWLELKDGRINKMDEGSTFNNGSHLDYYSNNNIYISNSNASSINHPNNNPTNSIKFIASLLSIFLPIRNDLFIEPEKSNRELSKLRVVIGTGNPAVSQKLVFILVGILGYEKFSDLYEEAQKLPQKSKHDLHRESNSKAIPIRMTSHHDEFRTNVLTRNNSLIIDPVTYSQMDANSASSPLRVHHSPSISTISSNVHVHSQRIPVPMLNRTSSYASLQNLSTSYGTNIPIGGNSQTPSNSWRNNFGSFMDKWKNSLTSSPTMSHFSNSPKTETPSPNLMEYDEYPWYATNKKSISISSPAPSTSSSNPAFNNHTPNHSHSSSTKKQSLLKLQNLGGYIANDSYKLTRSSINLIPSNFDNIVDHIKFEINSIMNDNFDYSLEDSNDDSVVVIPMESFKEINENKSINCVTAISLPLLVGYITEFRPQFGLMCCPNKNLHDSIFVDAMKDDLKNPLVNNSNIYFINLGMRKVSLFEFKKTSKKKSFVNEDPDQDSPLYLSKPSMSNLNKKNNEDLSMDVKPKHTPKSNLSKTIQSGFELNQRTLYTPTSDKDFDNTLAYEKIELYDHILGKIASTINAFLYEMKQDSDREEEAVKDKHDDDDGDDDDSKIQRENECCDEIRKLIEQILCISDSI